MSEDANTFGCDERTIKDCRQDSSVFINAFHKAIEDAIIRWEPQQFKINLDFDNKTFPKIYITAELVAVKLKG